MKSVTIKNTHSIVQYSDHVKDHFNISVALPENYESSNDTYPVLYVLDANIFYGLAVDTVRLLQYGQAVPEMIIVGIGYEENHMVLRNRDYLPTYHKSSEKSGGAEHFLSYMRDELMPMIQREYRTDQKHNTLFGDSYSGLFALYALFNETALFNRYIIGSPSIYWDEKMIFEVESMHFKHQKALNTQVFISVGALEAIEEPAFANMVGNVATMVSRLSKYEGITLYETIFEEESHQSVIPVTISRGLRKVFSHHKEVQ